MTAAKFIYARALLLCDAGEYGDQWKVADVATALGVTARTVEHLKQRFVEEGLSAALARRPHRKPRVAAFDGEFDARLTALACSQAPSGYQRWTVRLLAEYAASGLSMAAFASSEGLRYPTFASWVKKGGGGEVAQVPVSKPRFTEVRLPARDPEASGLSVTLPDGLILRGADPEALAALARALMAAGS